MNTSVRWLMDYLPGDSLSVEDVSEALTQAGFPIEGIKPLDSGDTMLDVEITSNRGDCLCHAGLAREIAAVTGRELRLPSCELGDGSGDVAFSVDIQVPKLCPRFTARIIKGITVKPSPDWLVERLDSIGIKSINNIVDASNFVLFELGLPNHCFDMSNLSGDAFVVRMAQKGEPVATLDDETHKLHTDDIVIADNSGVVSIGGVIGGKATSVTPSTTDILVETATWSPVHVRNTSRRHKITTDAAHRYERIVDPRAIDAPAARLASLIVEIGGGQIVPGFVDEGSEPKPPTSISLRPKRCRDILGIEIPTARMCQHLNSLDIQTNPASDTLDCTIPVNRPDLKREIDLIEEVSRIEGLDKLPIYDALPTTLRAMQPEAPAMRELARVLTGTGFYETVTFSFVTRDEAARYTPDGMRVLSVDEERRKGAPALRPSGIISLLHCRKANQDGRVERPGGLRFYETTAVFADDAQGKTVENRNLCLLADAPDPQEGLRLLAGALQKIAHSLLGPNTVVTMQQASPHCGAFRDEAYASVQIDGQHVGYVGILTQDECARYDLATPQAGAEINLAAILGNYPPSSSVEKPPAFPSIERDLSVVVEENVRWETLENAITSINPQLLTKISYIGTFRGKQVAKGQKSVSLRMTFQDPTRTLRHEEVDPQVESALQSLRKTLGAELRS